MATRHLVCLTFDFDGISGFIARGQTSASWISRGEFGVRVGARAEKWGQSRISDLAFGFVRRNSTLTPFFPENRL
jgi:hypothetical protein